MQAEEKHVDPADVESRLREAFSSDPETSLRRAIVCLLTDPAMPRDAKDRPRLHPLVLTLASAVLTALITFLYFRFWSA